MEFEVNGRKFRSGRMSAIEQFHVFRKLAPVLGAAGDMISALTSSSGAVDPATGLPSIAAMGIKDIMPLVHAISDLPEADCNMILDKCLSVVQIGADSSAGTSWANVWSTSAKRMMFEDDIDAMSMIMIAVHVIQDAIGNFSNALPSGSTGSAMQGLRTSR